MAVLYLFWLTDSQANLVISQEATLDTSFNEQKVQKPKARSKDMTMFSFEMCHMYVVAKARGRGARKAKEASYRSVRGRYYLGRHQQIIAKKDR
jgi:hypothetical protein